MDCVFVVQSDPTEWNTLWKAHSIYNNINKKCKGYAVQMYPFRPTHNHTHILRQLYVYMQAEIQKHMFIKLSLNLLCD